MKEKPRKEKPRKEVNLNFIRFIKFTIVKKNMYSLPQEIEVWYIIPAIRRELALTLIKKHKIKQKKVAEILGTSEAAISQYLSNKRGKEIKFPEAMKKEFDKSSREIVKDNRKAMIEMLRLIRIGKEKGVSCCLCRKYNKGVISMCSCRPEKEER